MSDPVVWGIDVSTTRVAFASTTGRTLSVEIPKLGGAPRLAKAREEAMWGARAFTVRENDPLCIWLEQPTGRYPSPPLVQMVGVVTEAIYTALSDLYAHPVTVFPIAVKAWKKAAIGNGNAGKPEVRMWAEANGYQPTNQDEADALGIAFAGRIGIVDELAA